ncbi:hypothetical protein EW146_g9323 [Bondarzewia mesenterica]|uniref:Uncharacterized protein n=1 Tax=Bondarzewia mesenterica TaxID=1095465 RepID=A0A4S4L7I7_9AGAM|nr:hypothetical protein EW146_g9323 [Bondarzewia mesenterica]
MLAVLVIVMAAFIVPVVLLPLPFSSPRHPLLVSLPSLSLPFSSPAIVVPSSSPCHPSLSPFWPSSSPYHPLAILIPSCPVAVVILSSPSSSFLSLLSPSSPRRHCPDHPRHPHHRSRSSSTCRPHRPLTIFDVIGDGIRERAFDEPKVVGDRQTLPPRHLIPSSSLHHKCVAASLELCSVSWLSARRACGGRHCTDCGLTIC